MHPHANIREEEQRKAEARVRQSGYASGGKVRSSDERQDAAMVKKGVAQHERHDHKGEPLTKLNLRGGGSVKGDKPKARPDKMARGGHVKGKPSVNINISNGGGEAERQMAFKQGAQVGTAVGGATARPPMMPMARPPMPPPAPPPAAAGPMPPPGAPPMGMPPGALPPGVRPPMKRGGKVGVNDDAGAGGAEGRLEKAGMEDEIPVRAHTRRRAGGRV